MSARRMVWLGRAVALAATCAISQPSLGETLQREMGSGQKIGLVPIFGVVSSTCAAYPAKEIIIRRQPAHGRATIEKHALDLSSALPHCKKKVTVPWLAYQPAPRYRGADNVSVSFSVPRNTGEMTFRYQQVEVEITVK